MAMSEMDEQLLKAAMSGNVRELKDMAQQNPEILFGRTPQQNTCLHISLIFGHEAFSKAVLALNQSLLLSINLDGETPLLVAVANGHVSLASAMLKLYQQLNLSYAILKQDNNGDNALHHAIRNGHSDLALELIAAQLDLSQGLNKYNESPMYIAVSSGFNDVSKKLLEIPISSHVGPRNENALHAAIRYANPGIAKTIAKARPFLAREKNNYEGTPIQYAVLWDRLDEIKVLLAHDSSLGYHAPLLVSAAHRGNVGVAQEILNYCPDAPVCALNGWTMLHQAVYSRQEKFVDYILKTPHLHKLVNMRDQNGKTALHIAVGNCDPKMVRSLLAHKATNLTIADKDGLPLEGLLADDTERAKTLNWNEVLMMISKARPTALTFLSSRAAKENITAKSIEEIKSLTQTYISNTSLIAILIATITFAAAFTLPGGYSNDSGSEGLPIMAKKVAFKTFLISDTLAMCSSLAVAFMCILARWEDFDFLLYYRSITKKLMWFAYMTTTVAFATGLYTMVAPRIMWLAVLVCILSIGLPFLTKLLGEWPLIKLQLRLGRNYQSELLEMV
ncbi:ankyrin repeat family protein [Rhynchospora pubera]|uniref:Ankyrin repeat family protein n=1 Tax=Rhynchospora pubera TaxID=906938 RepID=A0AAV8DGK8_9POAL|nr:ankyrin repeat family protein [Rhynchospora pubera]